MPPPCIAGLAGPGITPLIITIIITSKNPKLSKKSFFLNSLSFVSERTPRRQSRLSAFCLKKCTETSGYRVARVGTLGRDWEI